MDYYRLLPSYWIQNHPTNQVWDDTLNALLDKYEVIIQSEHRVKVGGVEIWIQNFPYAYGKPYNHDFLPRVATRKRLMDAVVKAIATKGTSDV